MSKWKHRLSNLDLVNMTATCETCGLVHIRSRSTIKKQYRCGKDADYRSMLRKREVRKITRKSMLGTECEICKSTDKLVWDHDHLTNTYRGTLCLKCNSGIGLLKEDIEILKAAISYLSKGLPT